MIKHLVDVMEIRIKNDFQYEEEDFFNVGNKKM